MSVLFPFRSNLGERPSGDGPRYTTFGRKVQMEGEEGVHYEVHRSLEPQDFV